MPLPRPAARLPIIILSRRPASRTQRARAVPAVQVPSQDIDGQSRSKRLSAASGAIDLIFRGGAFPRTRREAPSAQEGSVCRGGREMPPMGTPNPEGNGV